MRTKVAALLLLAASAAVAAAVTAVGTVEKLQLTSLTRDRAAFFLRTVLPQAAKGSRQTFEGTIAVANVPLPVKKPVVVAVQPAGRSYEAVFLLELDLASIPEGLVTKMGAHAVDPTINGQLLGEGGSKAPVCAAGLLRFGTPQFVAPASNVATFVRLGGVRLSGVGLAESEGEARALVYNPLGFPLGVRSLRYSLWIGDRRVVTGELKGIRLHPGKENDVRLPLRALNGDLIAAAGSAVVSGGTVDGLLLGEVNVKAGNDELTLPVKLSGTVHLVR